MAQTSKVKLVNKSKRVLSLPDNTMLGTELDEKLISSKKAHPTTGEYDAAVVKKWQEHPVVGKLFERGDLRVVA